jgi:lipoprotein-anchoring transpeptidase ErfK/SrfK
MRAAALAAGLVAAQATAAADLSVRVDLSDQRMDVVLRGVTLYKDWPVSTARAGKVTPIGTFRPQRMEPFHRSSLYDGAPMPWSIFFSGNYAIHGTTAVDRLGSPASAGCIRLAPENAERLYALVRALGMDRAEIVIEP